MMNERMPAICEKCGKEFMRIVPFTDAHILCEKCRRTPSKPVKETLNEGGV